MRHCYRLGIGYSLLLALIMGCSESPAPPANVHSESGINITWIEKYETWEQDASGALRKTDTMFLAEVGYTDEMAVDQYSAELVGAVLGETLAVYNTDDLLSFTNGFIYSRKSHSFDTPEALEDVLSARYDVSLENYGPQRFGPATTYPHRWIRRGNASTNCQRARADTRGGLNFRIRATHR